MFYGKTVTVIIAAAGSGSRMGLETNKQYIVIGGKPMLARSIEAFENNAAIDHIVVSVKKEEMEYCKIQIAEKYQLSKVQKIVQGGNMRQDSVYAALKEVGADTDYVLVHDGARPLVKQEEIHKVLMALLEHDGAGLAVPVKDTIKIVEDGQIKGTPKRETLYAIQTPQGFGRSVLLEAFMQAEKEGYYGTDETVLLERIGRKVVIVEGGYHNIKITTPEDVLICEAILKSLSHQGEPAPVKGGFCIRTGIGYDVHRLVSERKLIVGGVQIPHEKGLLGHSDADVLIHAMMDALLGACGMRDIGIFFPDTDSAFENISSLTLLSKVSQELKQAHYRINNIDATIVAQKPKFSPYIEQMQINIAGVLKIEKNRVNIKATTTEHLGFEGRKEGISAQAVATVEQILLDEK